MILSPLTISLAYSLLHIASADEVVCWAPDGKTKADNETYVACNKLGIQQDGVHSSCCNLDGKDEERDFCDPTGLCLNGGVLFRGFCTDKNWDSPACINVCTDEAKGGSPNETVEITPCPKDGTFCCGHNNPSCCGTEDAFELPTDASVIADDLTETATVTPESSSSNGSAFKNATIGLAVVLGVGLLLGLGVVLWLLRRNKHLRQQLDEQKSQPTIQEVQTPSMSYRDPMQADNTDAATDYTGLSSPHQQWSTYKSPVSPSLPEVDGHQRYSELDATVASDVIQSSNTSPRPLQTRYEDYNTQPTSSPYLNPEQNHQ